MSSQVHPSTLIRHNFLSSESSVGKSDTIVPPQPTGFESWPIEVALTYALCLGSVCIHGRSSLIQRVALEGRVRVVEKGKGPASRSVSGAGKKRKNYGLLELTELDNGDENTDITKGNYCTCTLHL